MICLISWRIWQSWTLIKNNLLLLSVILTRNEDIHSSPSILLGLLAILVVLISLNTIYLIDSLRILTPLNNLIWLSLSHKRHIVARIETLNRVGSWHHWWIALHTLTILGLILLIHHHHCLRVRWRRSRIVSLIFLLINLMHLLRHVASP